MHLSPTIFKNSYFINLGNDIHQELEIFVKHVVPHATYQEYEWSILHYLNCYKNLAVGVRPQTGAWRFLYYSIPAVTKDAHGEPISTPPTANTTLRFSPF